MIMKKMVFVLAILLMAVPAMAQTVTVYATCESEADDANGLVTISYDVNGAPDPCEIRAFALDIIVDNNGVIEDAWSDSEDYWVFPGTYDDDESVVAPSGDPGALGGIGTGGITTEQGSLYAISEGDTPPPDACDLLQFTVSGDPCTTVCVSISVNTTRAGIVSKDNPGTPPDITFKGCCVDIGEEPKVCGNLTPEQIVVWQAWGEPDNWCTPCWRCGDVTGDGLVFFGDVIQAFNYFKDGIPDGKGDVNMDGLEFFGDVIDCFNMFKSGQGCTPAYCQ